MGSLSIVHWIIIIAVALLLFGGRGKISSLMGDFAEGIKAFKKGMSEDEQTAVVTPRPSRRPSTISSPNASPRRRRAKRPAEAARPPIRLTGGSAALSR